MTTNPMLDRLGLADFMVGLLAVAVFLALTEVRSSFALNALPPGRFSGAMLGFEDVKVIQMLWHLTIAFFLLGFIAQPIRLRMYGETSPMSTAAQAVLTPLLSYGTLYGSGCIETCNICVVSLVFLCSNFALNLLANRFIVRRRDNAEEDWTKILFNGFLASFVILPCIYSFMPLAAMLLTAPFIKSSHMRTLAVQVMFPKIVGVFYKHVMEAYIGLSHTEQANLGENQPEEANQLILGVPSADANSERCAEEDYLHVAKTVFPKALSLFMAFAEPNPMCLIQVLVLGTVCEVTFTTLFACLELYGKDLRRWVRSGYDRVSTNDHGRTQPSVPRETRAKRIKRQIHLAQMAERVFLAPAILAWGIVQPLVRDSNVMVQHFYIGVFFELVTDALLHFALSRVDQNMGIHDDKVTPYDPLPLWFWISGGAALAVSCTGLHYMEEFKQCAIWAMLWLKGAMGWFDTENANRTGIFGA